MYGPKIEPCVTQIEIEIVADSASILHATNRKVGRESDLKL